MPTTLVSSIPWVASKPEIRVLSTWEAAWLAGVIDSDGSFGLYKAKDRSKMLTVQVANICPEFLSRVREVIGAGSNVNHVPSLSHRGRKPMFNFVLKGVTRGYWVLKQILPFLIVKKDKAAAILRVLESEPFGTYKNSTPAARVKRSAWATNSWKNPETRAKRIAGLRAHFANRNG